MGIPYNGYFLRLFNFCFFVDLLNSQKLKFSKYSNLASAVLVPYAAVTKFKFISFFSSTDPKARVSYCHSAPSVRPSGVNFSHFRFQETSSSEQKATATNRMHSNDLEACGMKCCYFWIHFEVNF